ncbi:MAG: DUF975 family protein [Treponemataceae bacterium]
MFFDGSKLKRSAKQHLKGNFFASAIITATMLILSLLLNLPSAQSGTTQFFSTNTDFSNSFYMNIKPLHNSYHSFLSMISIIVIGILFFAQSYFFLQIVQRPLGTKLPFDVFFNGLNYWFLAIRATIWTALWITLWSFVFFIPAIIKTFAYSQVFYILADNPKIGAFKALKMSTIMTRGYKWDLFILNLSFIGWLILSSLTGGVLLLWVLPYMMSTHANAYLFLKDQAIKNERLSKEDFQTGNFYNEYGACL